MDDDTNYKAPIVFAIVSTILILVQTLAYIELLRNPF